MAGDAPYHECQVRVRYAETDTMGIVYYSNHFVYFEVGRVAFLRAVGADYRAMEEQGVLAPVVEAHCRYLAPAYFDDLLTIRTRLSGLRRAGFSLEYQIVRPADAVVIATGSTSHVCVSRENRRPIGIPEHVRQALLAFAGDSAP